MNVKHYLFKRYLTIMLLLLFCVACGQAPIESQQTISTPSTSQSGLNQPSSAEPAPSFAADNKMETTKVLMEETNSMDSTSSATFDLSNLSEEEQAIAIATAYEPIASALSHYPEYNAFAYSEEEGYWEVEFFSASEEEQENEVNQSNENEESEENEENNEDNEGDEEGQESDEENEEGDEEGEEGEWLGYVFLNLSNQEIIEYGDRLKAGQVFKTHCF